MKTFSPLTLVASLLLLFNTSAASAANETALDRLRTGCVHVDTQGNQQGFIVILEQLQTQYVDENGIKAQYGGSRLLERTTKSYIRSPNLSGTLRAYKSTFDQVPPTIEMVEEIFNDNNRRAVVDVEGIIHREPTGIGFVHVTTEGQPITFEMLDIYQTHIGGYNDHRPGGRFRKMSCTEAYTVPVE